MSKNKIYIHIAVTLVMVLLTQTGIPQFMTRDAKKIADGYYQQGDYASAAAYYEEALTGKSDQKGVALYQMQRHTATGASHTTQHGEILYRLANSYRLLNNYTQAVTRYEQLLKEATAAYPLASLYYGISLRANASYTAAEKALRTFLDTYTAKDEYRQLAQKELADLAFIRQQSPRSDIQLSKLGNTINKEGASYAAGWLNAGTLLFTSTRTAGNKTAGKALYVNALYTSPLQEETPGEATRLLLPAIDEAEQGVATVSPDGNKLFFTGWTVTASGSKKSAIYISRKSNNEWTHPVPLPGSINVEGYSARQPFITPDAQYLFFASDRPGGQGGFDIWYAPLDSSGRPGKAMNAGAVINTKQNEEAPFYHTGSSTLVFASNGRTGMGGYDLYAATGTMNHWAEPQNMGIPVNSVKDDIYFVSRGAELLDHALLSSDRASACCLELFAISRTVAPVVADSIPPRTASPVVASAPLPNKPVAEMPLVTRDILFAFNDTSIDTASAAYLNQLAGYLQQHAGVAIEIGAYTDGKGTVAYNLQLAEKRANACVQYLVAKGIAAERLVAKGYGECCPLEAETTADGKDIPEAREKNRRLEIKVLQGK